MIEPSPILVTLAVSHWNPILSSVILGVLAAILATRAMLIRQALFDWAILVVAALWLSVVVLREGYVQDFLASTVGLNLAGTRFLAHSAAVLSGSVELILVCAWRSTEKITGRRLCKVLVACLSPALLFLCVMALLAWPALAANRAIEEWPAREALYAAVYAVLPIVGAAAVGIEGARAAFGRSGGIAVRSVGVLIVTAVSASIFDHLYRGWTGFMILRRPGTLEIVLDRAHATDMMLIPVVAIASTLGFLSYEFGRRPDLRARALDEIASVLGDRVPTFEDVPKLRFLRACIEESLRLYPPAPGIFRRATQETKIGPYSFAAGEWVFVLLLAVHRDPAVWGNDAVEFNPDRFIGTGDTSRRRPAAAYKPFGTGIRSCIGRQFAQHEITVCMAELLRQLDWTVVSPSTAMEFDETLTLRPRNLVLEYTPR